MASTTTWILALGCVVLAFILVIVISMGGGPLAPQATPEELAQKKAEIESEVDKAIAIIHMEYDFEDDNTPSSSGKYCYWYNDQGNQCFGELFCEERCYWKSQEQYYAGIQGDMDQAILYLATARQKLQDYKRMAPSDTTYYNGWMYAIDAVETDAMGRRKAHGINAHRATDRSVDEALIQAAADTLALQNDAVEKYEYILSRYPGQATKVGAMSRLQVMRESVRNNTQLLDTWVGEYQAQQMLNAMLGAYICAETGGVVCPN